MASIAANTGAAMANVVSQSRLLNTNSAEDNDATTVTVAPRITVWLRVSL